MTTATPQRATSTLGGVARTVPHARAALFAVSQTPTGYTLPVDDRDGSVPVSIKVKVVDSNKTSIEQSVMNAFSTRPTAA